MAEVTVPWDSRDVWEASGFLRFLAEHRISRDDLLACSTVDGEPSTPLRFFRLKQRPDDAKSAKEDPRLQAVAASLAQAIAGETQPIQPRAVPWLHGFYSLPSTAPLARVELYRDGQLYGMDISSGYAVSLLGVQPGEHVLDLCCAPGAKLTMLADLLQLRGSVTGVDFSRARLGACRQLVHKYDLLEPSSDSASPPTWRCRLFHADGRSFDIGPKTECNGPHVLLDTREIAERPERDRKRRRENKSARARAAKRSQVLRVDATLYDKVLVDAECTHDGSSRHLQRLDTADKWVTYVRDHLNVQEVTRILALQAALIRNGFRLLRPGGVLIYSTCSLSVQQNEDVVSSFLRDEPRAILDQIALKSDVPCKEGRLPGTLRFTPSQNTSGLFIARIRKAGVEVDAVPQSEGGQE